MRKYVTIRDSDSTIDRCHEILIIDGNYLKSFG
ncbi:hypothetical protein Mpal_1168 [Methanosphaerula palustris E1-9c]|uniref:Uncharacterized protein n=1 Tax=Methanosphaerula palustris (strain ATCC BAA-1556 / DSM 19958 / E1-9c) TaxID=521011 RepID=B8GHA5_METPE|nr:hypothetical protein Mpal_1168 [Methanosphaerula palustris E1-9c]